MHNIFAVVLILLVSIITVLGDYFIKLSSSNNEKFMLWNAFTLGVVFYICTAFGWFFLMKHMKLASIGIIYGTATAIMLAAIGYLFFGEQLTRHELVGVAFGIISIVMLSRFSS